MRGVILVCASALLAAVPQAAQRQAAVELQVALIASRPDGSDAGGAESIPAASEWFEFNPATCGVAVGSSREPTPSPGDRIWHIAGRITQQTGDQFTIELTVDRVEGAPSRPTPQTQTVHLGERVVLEEIKDTGTRCDGRTFRLVAGVVRPPDSLLPLGPPGPAGGAGSGRARAAVTAGAVVASGAGRGSSGGVHGGAATLVGLTTAPGGGSLERSNWAAGGPVNPGSRDPALEALIPVDLHALAQASYDAELWLVDTASDQVPQTLKQSGHLDPSGHVFEFPLLTVQSGGRAVTMDVAVNLRPMATESRQTVLRAAIARLIDGGQSVGLTSQAILMPDQTAVVSFEMPPPVAGPALASDHHLEVRVRIRPGPEALPR